MSGSPPLPEGFGPRMKARREALGWSKSDLARRAGTSRGTVTEVENGKRTNMLAGTVKRLEDVLGIELRDGPRDPGRAVGLGAPCLFCERLFEQGDRGMVIGNVALGGAAELRWVHLRCLAREVGGESAVAAYDAAWGPGDE